MRYVITSRGKRERDRGGGREIEGRKTEEREGGTKGPRSELTLGPLRTITNSTLPRFTPPRDTTMETQWYKHTFHFFATARANTARVGGEGRSEGGREGTEA